MKKKIFSLILLIIVIILFFIIQIEAFPINEGWSNNKIISSESTDDAYRAILRVDNNGNVHIAWNDRSDYENSDGDWNIFYKLKNSDNNWTKTEVISINSTRITNCLFLDVDQIGNIHIVWIEQTNSTDIGGVFYRKKIKDVGWSDIELVSAESRENFGCPVLYVDTLGNVHFTWSEKNQYFGSGSDLDIFYRMKKQDGSWNSIELVTSESDFNSWRPSLAVDSFYNVHIIWMEDSNYLSSGDDYDLFYKMKNQEGIWSSSELITYESNRDSVQCSYLIVDSSDNLHVAWIDKTDFNGAGFDDDIFYKKRLFNGVWTEAELVSNESNSFSNWPSLAVDKNDTIYIVWKDKIIFNDINKDFDIYYKKKPLEGNWSIIELVSTESSNDSNFPSIDIYSDFNIVHVSWWDQDSNMVVYYNSKYSFDNQPLFTDVSNGEQTPGFEFYFFIIGIVYLLFLFNKRFN